MYWYIIEAQMEDGRWWELSRYYADFYDFQIALLEKFPDEAGNRGKQRSLPFMPGPVAHVTDAISNGRRQNLDEYIKKIIQQPQHIREDILVRKLFAPKPGQDYEIDPEAIEDDYRLSGHSLAQTQSRQSSGASSSLQNSTYSAVPLPNTRYPQQNGVPANRPSQDYGQKRIPPPLHSQASNLTTNSNGTTNSATAPPTATSGVPPGLGELGPQIRVKLETNSDIIAIRVPESMDFKGLKDKIIHRLALDMDKNPVLKYRDDNMGTVVNLATEEDWMIAKQNRNLRILVNR